MKTYVRENTLNVEPKATAIVESRWGEDLFEPAFERSEASVSECFKRHTERCLWIDCSHPNGSGLGGSLSLRGEVGARGAPAAVWN